MGEIFIVIIVGGLLWVVFKSMIVNAELPISEIKEYLDKNNLIYVRHKRVKIPWNPNFENGESIFTPFAYRKHQYEIDVTDCDGNPKLIRARWYQSMSFFHKNMVYFEIEKRVNKKLLHDEN